ncbi:MAG: class I SAM-dependent methyltransferase [Clostridia bacterium]|nr:class I SAM-dependent methyltransferase [Clostridia bacterium]
MNFYDSQLQENTVQHTLCIPLWGRKIATEKLPHIFPDFDAKRIIDELGVDLSNKLIYKMQYVWVNCFVRQYNLAWEIENYLKTHPRATVVELGAGLSCLRRQMMNETNPWYCLDMENVINLREKHIPKGSKEKNIVCDLNDYSWFEKIDFNPDDGIVFTAGGLFYYFEEEQVKNLFIAMSEYFKGGMITFDAVNPTGLKFVNMEVKMAGNETKSFFSLKDPKSEIEAWSENIINVSEKEYINGYLKHGYKQGITTKISAWLMKKFHWSFMIHAEFKR